MPSKLPPRNPYVAGKAVGEERGFFGREDVFRTVETVLSSPHQNAVVLFGQRRIGKTSILLQLRRRLPSPPFRTIYFDLMDRARKPLGTVLYELAATVAVELGLPQPSQADLKSMGEGFQDKFLPALYQSLGESVRPVLLFDEFDVLDVAAEEQLPLTAAARSFFPYLRHLMESEPRLAYVFVVGRKAEDLSIDVKATFKATRYQRISMLDDESARQLVGLAERNGSLRFTPVAVDCLLGLTACHPYLTQLMCQLLFDRAYATPPPDTPTVDVADINAAVPKALEAGENVFEWIWDGLPPAERVISSAIAGATAEKALITEDELTGILQHHGIRILIRELELAPKTLIEWEMLRRTAGGYGFFTELMRRWVAERKPLPKVKDELDRVNPIADQQYRLGHTYYRLGNLQEAIAPLQAALQVNPNHLKARLLLGETLTEQGAVEEAVRQLEEAYRRDEDAARYPLVRALLAQGEGFEKAGREDDALGIYQRVLEISPREMVAHERRQLILIARGDRALGAGDFDGALAAYREARAQEKIAALEAWRRRNLVEAGDRALSVGDFDRALTAYREAEAEEKIAALEVMRRRRALETLAEEAEASVHAENWARAAEVYQRLAELDPEDKRWPEGLAQVEKESDFARRYAEGLGAMQQAKWTEAQRAFADVAHARPDYQDAADHLATVTRRLKAERAAAKARETAASPNAVPPAVQPAAEHAPRVPAQAEPVKSRRRATASPDPISVSFSPDGSLLASEDWQNHRLRLWKTSDGSLVRDWSVDSAHSMASIAVSPDGSLVASGASLWSTRDGTLVRVCKKQTGIVHSVSFSPGGDSLASADKDGTVRLWKVGDGSLLREMRVNTYTVRSIAFSPDGSLLASGSDDNTVRLWNVSDGSLVRELTGHTYSVRTVAFSLDGKYLASGADRGVRLWNIGYGSLVREWEYAYSWSVAFSPDGSLLASGEEDNTVKLWRISDGNLVRELKGHTSLVGSVAFSPDGSLLASGSWDGTARLWKVSDGSLVRQLNTSK